MANTKKKTSARNPPSDKSAEIFPADNKSLTEVVLVTYLPYQLVLDRVNEKIADGVVLHAYLAYHDKDPKEPHTHVYLRLIRDRKVGQIKNWFRGLDDKGQLVNTFAQYRKGSVADIRDYFTHRKEKDKYPYPDDVVVELGDCLFVDEGIDSCLSIFEELITGTPMRDMIRKYGKDFVYHYASWRAIKQDYILESCPTALDLQTGEIFKKEISKDALPFDV